MRCGTCQSVCPVFADTLSEADVARGKLALLSNLAAETLSDAGGVRERLDRCLLCGSCQTACPSGVKITDIFFEAREINAKYLGLNPVKKLVFKAILTHPKLFGAAVKFSLPLGRIFLRPDKNAPQTAYSPLLKPPSETRHIPAPPANTFSQELEKLTSHGEIGNQSSFLPGCMGDKLYTSTTKACLKFSTFTESASESPRIWPAAVSLLVSET
ncbi:MAG: 4Fe-4S dicluster domain-containing protein [Bacilli bacterium]